MPKPRIEPRGLGRADAADYIGVSPRKFDAMVKDGTMPKPVRVGGRVLWDRRMLDAAFDALSDQAEAGNLEFVA